MPAQQFVAVCFTVNNPEEGCMEEALIPAWVKYCVWQIERGESGTRHVQGYAELASKKTLSALKAWLPTAHFERRRGTAEQARDYCMKEDSREEGPFEHGVYVPSQQGQRNDLEQVRDAIMSGASKRQIYLEYPGVAARHPRYIDTVITYARADAYEGITSLVPKYPWQQRILDIVESPPMDRDIWWIYDPFGNSGKTYLARYLVDSKGAFYSNGGKGSDICFTYDGEGIVIFDYVRDSKEYVNYGVIEQIKNGILTSGKYESTTKRFKKPHVFIFANFRAEDGKFSQDRLRVIELNSVHLEV